MFFKRNRITHIRPNLWKTRPAINSALNTLLAADYDEMADVMYIYFGGKPLPCKNIETDDVVIRKTLDGRLNGITIVDFKKRIGG